MAEDEQMSQSAMVRELVKDGIDHRDTEPEEPADRETLADSAAESTLFAFALYAVVQVVAFPGPAEWLLLGAAAVFAAAGVAGYVSGVVELESLAERVGLPGRSVEEIDDEGKAAAAMHPRVRDVGGVLILLALAVTAVTAVI
jgi:hypothetical protein